MSTPLHPDQIRVLALSLGMSEHDLCQWSEQLCPRDGGYRPEGMGFYPNPGSNERSGPASNQLYGTGWETLHNGFCATVGQNLLHTPHIDTSQGVTQLGFIAGDSVPVLHTGIGTSSETASNQNSWLLGAAWPPPDPNGPLLGFNDQNGVIVAHNHHGPALSPLSSPWPYEHTNASQYANHATESWAPPAPSFPNGEQRYATQDYTDVVEDFEMAPDEVTAYANNAPRHGPCSKVWSIPKRSRKRKSNLQQPTSRPPKPSTAVGNRRKRSAFLTESLRASTALTRRTRGCIRCRTNRKRCVADPSDPDGVCLPCKGMVGRQLCNMPCLRYIVTDAVLFRKQEAPYQLFSTRWKTMDIVDIRDWASDEIKTIEISQIFINAPWTVEVRKFVPDEGDLLEERWVSNGRQRSHQTSCYALAEMNKVSDMMKLWTAKRVLEYIFATVGQSDQLLADTYLAAFHHATEAKTDRERALTDDCLRLWLICRLTSNPCHLRGKEKLGVDKVDDRESPHFNKYPIPPIITAQMECILYTKFLHPLSAGVLRRLHYLVNENKPQYWMTIYLVMFLLLHNCAMMTRRDMETAQQYGCKDRYANPSSILQMHKGAQILLAHFHFRNKGVAPFSIPHDDAGRTRLARAADLNDEQVDFIWKTSDLIQDTERAKLMRRVRDDNQVEHDLFWTSCLYDTDWKS